MPDLARRPAPTPTSTPAPTAAGPTQGPDNSALAEALSSHQDPVDVVLYLTLNNTTHDYTELPEALAALKQAEAEGLGHKELLPISDPYWTEPTEGDVRFSESSDAYSFGQEGATRLQFWHGDPNLQQGQARVGEQVLQLGTSGVDPADAAAVAQVRADWTTALLTLGMAPTYADAVVVALLGSGDFTALASGDGATNELMQFAMAMYRSEIGEIDVTDIVLSGHHWAGNDETPDAYAQGIWGEIPGAAQNEPHYDDVNDFFGLADFAALKEVFPKAYAKVKSVQLAACNTNRLGMPNEEGGVLSTEQFLQQTFPNIEMASYWTTLAPLAAAGFETNGEFLLDAARQQNGQDAAARDSRHNPPGLKRALLNDQGELAPITMKTNTSSYAGNATNGLRGTSTKDFDERTDLADWLYTAPTLPASSRE